jgi:hypothetical protein
VSGKDFIFAYTGLNKLISTMTSLQQPQEERGELTSSSNGVMMSEKSRNGTSGDVNGPGVTDQTVDIHQARGDKKPGELSEKVEDVPPNGGYGWVIVACIATING